MEPLLEDVDLTEWIRGPELPDIDPGCRDLDWVIIGGESGKGARPLNINWIRSLVKQCKAASVPVFVKQLGAKPYCEVALSREPCSTDTFDQPLKLRDSHGGDMAEWSEDLRIREMPEVRS